MSLSEQTTAPSVEGLGASAREFLAYCEAERERRKNSGEAFDEAAFDQAVEMVLSKLRVLADEGWS
ncbi:MAG: nodulation protein E [Candidatus Thiodiazotropha sp.]